jgi:hypothetical protein
LPLPKHETSTNGFLQSATENNKTLAMAGCVNTWSHATAYACGAGQSCTALICKNVALLHGASTACGAEHESIAVLHDECSSNRPAEISAIAMLYSVQKTAAVCPHILLARKAHEYDARCIAATGAKHLNAPQTLLTKACMHAKEQSLSCSACRQLRSPFPPPQTCEPAGPGKFKNVARHGCGSLAM